MTTLEAGQCGATDPEQLAFAVKQGRAIYTFNVGDFAKLHRQYLVQSIDHFGIIVIPDQRYTIGEKVRQLAGFIRQVTAEEMISRMEFL